MELLIFFTFLGSLGLLVFGLINPIKALDWWYKGVPTRFKVFQIYGSILLATMFVITMIQRDKEKRKNETSISENKELAADSSTTEYNADGEKIEKAEKKPGKRFTDVIELVEDTKDYHQEIGTLKLISRNPLHIQLAKTEVEGQNEDIIKEQIDRNFISVGYRIFAYSDVKQITISSTALLWDSQNNKALRFLDEYKKTLVLKRSVFEKIAKEVGITNFEDFFGVYVGEKYLEKVHNEKLARLMYNDNEAPNLDSAIKAITGSN
jgi:hypothetical protein